MIFTVFVGVVGCSPFETMSFAVFVGVLVCFPVEKNDFGGFCGCFGVFSKQTNDFGVFCDCFGVFYGRLVSVFSDFQFLQFPVLKCRFGFGLNGLGFRFVVRFWAFL